MTPQEPAIKLVQKPHMRQAEWDSLIEHSVASMREEAARYDDIRSKSDGCCDELRETIQDSDGKPAIESHASRCAEQQRGCWIVLTSATTDW